MKPDWDKLAEKFADSKDVAIIDVDCTKDDSKDLCSNYGVQGYPTIKYITGSTDPKGDDYKGGRTYDDLEKFAEENLGPSCGPDNLDLCNDDQKAEIAKFTDMGADDLQKLVDEKQGEIDKAEETFKTELEALQKRYEELVKEKEAAVEAASPDLRTMRTVLGSLTKGADAKDEL